MYLGKLLLRWLSKINENENENDDCITSYMTFTVTYLIRNIYTSAIDITKTLRPTLSVPERHICRLGVDCQTTYMSFGGWLPKRHICRLGVDCQTTYLSFRGWLPDDIFVVWGLTARRHICRLIDFFLAVHGFRHNQ